MRLGSWGWERFVKEDILHVLLCASLVWGRLDVRMFANNNYMVPVQGLGVVWGGLDVVFMFPCGYGSTHRCGQVVIHFGRLLTVAVRRNSMNHVVIVVTTYY
jgi:hypothetical protein